VNVLEGNGVKMSKALELITDEKKDVLDPRKKLKKEPCAKATESIRESLRKITEQMVVLNPKLDDLAALRQEIGSLHLKVDNIESSIGTLITLMEKKIDVDALCLSC